MSRSKRVFVSFAVEDRNCRDLLRGQSQLGSSPIDYTDYSVREPWSSSWKTNCRQRIRGCDGMIALLSSKTQYADGARWEITCAFEEGVPVLGVHIHRWDNYVPPELTSKPVIPWTWEGIADFIRRL